MEYLALIKKLYRGCYEINSVLANYQPRTLYGSFNSVKEQYKRIYGTNRYAIKFKQF